MNRALFDVAVGLLEKHGWEALNLDRIAEAAGVSRATVWRHGVTRTSVEAELRRQLAEDYRALLWPALTMTGTGAQRLDAALDALCAVCDRHLALLAHSEMFLHDAPLLDEDGAEINLLAPLVRIIEDGTADGTLAPVAEPWPYAVVLFNTVTLPYVHVRVRHAEYGWTPERARAFVLGLVTDGYRPRSRPLAP
ncbi:helix-turn-helix domain-containing protein [Longispora sp. K20-0274]|uniref:TetR/AcrR family transcriptional regulator n=1 Tax=Longispora sp. K20-0274 TaxID=3088255 RepID=UPI00399A9B02